MRTGIPTYTELVQYVYEKVTSSKEDTIKEKAEIYREEDILPLDVKENQQTYVVQFISHNFYSILFLPFYSILFLHFTIHLFVRFIVCLSVFLFLCAISFSYYV